MNLIHRLELNFWRFFIPRIRESSAVQYLFPMMYPLIRNRIFLQYLVPASICAFLGLAVGVFLGLVNTFW
jgi:hypothetical protein